MYVTSPRNYRILCFVACFLLTNCLLSAQTPHLLGWHSKTPFRESFASCFQKSVEAMEKSTLEDVKLHDGWVVSGSNRYLRVAISCIQVQEGVLINVQVAGSATQERAAIRMRDQLKAYITSRDFPDGSRFADYIREKGVLGPRLQTEKSIYRPLEKIRVEFSSLPAGYPQAWITLVPADAAPGAFRQWRYTENKENGSVEFMGLTRGDYEARFHYSNSDKEIRARCSFQVE
ncbi:MAG: hypothetical protein KJT03_02020 [Verrucomicrobiae bacterium]|nr:hypothetical protein [Verrucomicrobiae bacterium]